MGTDNGTMLRARRLRPPRRTPPILALAGTCLLTACAADSGAVRVGSGPSSLVDSYLFIRGMALSYTHSGRAGPAEITRLIGYDHAALLAVLAAELDPTDAKRQRAQAALEAMLGYAETEDLEPRPAPDSPLAAALRAR